MYVDIISTYRSDVIKYFKSIVFNSGLVKYRQRFFSFLIGFQRIIRETRIIEKEWKLDQIYNIATIGNNNSPVLPK